MSIVERAADLLAPAAHAPINPVGIPSVVTTAARNLIERSSDNEIVKSRPTSAENRGPAAHMDPAGEPPQRPSSRVVHIDLAKLRAQNVITPDGERTSNAESFRRIKRKILLDAENPKSDAPTNLVMVSSSLPGEGKTFCVINLAISIAMEMDKTVLLVDADVAKPSITSMLDIKADDERGLMDVLLDKRIDLADVLCKTDIGKLSILPAGKRHSRATEMLASDRMAELLVEISQRYHDRIILFDSPPLLFASEASALAEHMGQIMMVVEAGRTTEKVLKDALARIETCNVVGLLLNKGSSSGSWYGSYGYGYGYGYGS